MLPRHAYLSATMLALAATMSKEDNPVVPSPEPDEGAMDYDATLGREGPESHWSSVLGCAILDDMQANEEAVGAAIEAKVGAAFPHMQPWEAQGSRHDIPRVTGTPDDSMRFLLRSWAHERPEQRASKKARNKRKAKKGWS